MDAAPQWADSPGTIGDGVRKDDIPAFIKDPHSVRPYAHFDRRVSFASVANRVMDPSYVKSHTFYPLIEKPIRRIKWDDDKVSQRKDRPIKYAAHVDRCIYQYYAGLLNERYNEFARLLEIRDVAIAYRTNMPGKSNCDFAMLAFSAMRDFGSCYVYAGDFENFFETLDHKYLKQRVRRLFEDGHIPDDYYHVLKLVHAMTPPTNKTILEVSEGRSRW